MRTLKPGDWVIVSECGYGTPEGRDVDVVEVKSLAQAIGQPLQAELTNGTWWDAKTHLPTEGGRHGRWEKPRIRVTSASDLRARIRETIVPVLACASQPTLATLYIAVLAANARRP